MDSGRSNFIKTCKGHNQCMDVGKKTYGRQEGRYYWGCLMVFIVDR